MTDMTIAELVRESIDAFNRADWPAIEALIGPGYVYEETGTDVRCDRDGLVPYLKGWKLAAPDAAGEISRMLIDGTSAAVEVVWRGTQTGPLQTPAGPIPPSGRHFEIRATLWQDWSDGTLLAERHHLDVLGLLTQLGALPAPQHA